MVRLAPEAFIGQVHKMFKNTKNSGSVSQRSRKERYRENSPTMNSQRTYSNQNELMNFLDKKEGELSKLGDLIIFDYLAKVDKKSFDLYSLFAYN